MTAELTHTAAVSAADFRAAFRRHAAGVVVITADSGGGPRGITATSLASISLEPALVSFAVSTTASAWSTLAVADSIAVHLLGHQQAELARRFATSGIDRFAFPTKWERLADGVPVLTDAPTVLRCLIRNRLEAGDHRVVIAEVIDVIHRGAAAPLVYHDGEYRTVVSAAVSTASPTAVSTASPTAASTAAPTV
ncbi:MAG: flavin reductase domain protein FMN-binding protein [Frankiales bacterium]|nr:flavin reductase domain protein FMN-binding protein [Frankiales bacterium]